jgi:hypothetical protein
LGVRHAGRNRCSLCPQPAVAVRRLSRTFRASPPLRVQASKQLGPAESFCSHHTPLVERLPKLAAFQGGQLASSTLIHNGTASSNQSRGRVQVSLQLAPANLGGAPRATRPCAGAGRGRGLCTCAARAQSECSPLRQAPPRAACMRTPLLPEGACPCRPRGPYFAGAEQQEQEQCRPSPGGAFDRSSP